MDNSAAAEREDEIIAVRSIYGPASLEVTVHGIVAFIPDDSTPGRLELRVMSTSDYPSAAPPSFELHSDLLPAAVIAELAAQLEAMFEPGGVVLFTWIEFLRQEWQAAAHEAAAVQSCEEQLAATTKGAAIDDMDQDTPAHGASSGRNEAMQLAMAEVAAKIVHGEAVTEKKSTFQAHVAPVESVQQAEAVLECLLSNNKIRGASHPCIMAYRIERSDAPGTFWQDNDDDGEAAAGGRLLQLLQLVDARNVVAVVTRWFGGIHLGPARFALITNAARQLLDECGYIAAKTAAGKRGKKGPTTR